MGFEFANPALLMGSLLFTVPLIIHLLNRRRYRIKRWAAMDFLLAAFKRTRRRLRMENFLLLLLRCLIIILLALAMAKPFVSSGSAAAVLSSVRRDVVIVLDHSYSMGYRLTPDETCYDLAKLKIGRLLAGLDAASGDTVTLILMGEVPEFAVPYLSSPSDAMVKLERLREPSIGGADFAALVDLLAGEVSQTIEGPKEVYLFTDLQAATLGGQEGGQRRATAALLTQAADKGAKIRFVDVGPQEPEPPNAAVLEVETLEPQVTTDAPVTFVATVQNFGKAPVVDRRGTFLLDGKTLESRRLDIDPGSKAAAECSLVVQDPGSHHVAFQLEGDFLETDDIRWHAFDARGVVNVLIVDGDFRDDWEESEVADLLHVIDPLRMDGGLERGTVFDPLVADLEVFNAGQRRPDDFDCVLLVNPAGLSEEAAESLFNYVQSGGSLAFFMGDRVDAAALNQRLRNGTGEDLLPVELLEPVGEDASAEPLEYYRITPDDYRHPLFSIFDDPKYRPLLEVPVFKFMGAKEPGEDARVLARLTDTRGTTYPAVVEKTIGLGRVLFFALSVSPSWSLIPETPVTFLPLVHNLLHYLTTRDPRRFNLNVGDVISRTVVEFPEKVVLLSPSGQRDEITEQAEERRFGRYLLPLGNTPLEERGPYTLEVSSSLSGKTLLEAYAANVDPGEGDLGRVDEDRLADLFPGADIAVIDTPWMEGEDARDDTRKGEFWRPLLFALLALVGLELLLSWKFGNYR